MIEAFTGLPGAGKTYFMTKRALKEMKKGRKVYANYPLEGAIRYRNINEIFDVKNALVLIDEAGLIAPAAFWQRIPYEYLSNWRQHRKSSVDIWYTAQDLFDVATALRRVTQFVTEIERLGKIMFYRTYNPRTKEKYGNGIMFIRKKIYEKYDTYYSVEKPEFLTK